MPRRPVDRHGHVTLEAIDCVGGIVTELLQHLFLDDDAQDLIEYALLSSLISVVCILVLTDLGTTIQEFFDLVNQALLDAAN